MKKITLLLLWVSVLSGFQPASVYAMNGIGHKTNTLQIIEKKTGLSDKKIRRIQRLAARFQPNRTSDHANRYIWLGLFGLGLALCLSFFSVTLGGIVAAAAIACLIFGGIFKLGTL